MTNLLRNFKELVEDSKADLSLIDKSKDIEIVSAKEPFRFFEYAYSGLISIGMALLLAFLVLVQNEVSHYFSESYEGIVLSSGIRNLIDLLQVATVHIGCCLIAWVMSIAHTDGEYYEYNNPYLSTETFNRKTDLKNISDPICKARFNYFNTIFRVFYGVSLVLYLVFQYYQMK